MRIGQVHTVPRGDISGKTQKQKPYVIFFSGQVKVMSYNAWNMGLQGYQAANTPATLQARANVINKEKPDVIALQEVYDRQSLEDFNKNYLGNKYPNIVFHAVTADRHQAYMAKSDITVVSTKSHQKCQVNGQPCFVRDVPEATMETKDGYKFTLYNVHLKSMRGGETQTQPVRVREATAAAGIIRHHIQNTPNAKVMVMGDLNVKKNALGKQVVDLLSNQADPDPAVRMTDILAHHNQTGDTWGRAKRTQRFDYMFVSQSMLSDVNKAYVVGKLGVNPWKKASDHLPVVTVIDTPVASGTAKPKAEAKVMAKGQMLSLTA